MLALLGIQREEELGVQKLWRQLLGIELSDKQNLAPQVGFEPTTLRLTAGCSAIELLRSENTLFACLSCQQNHIRRSLDWKRMIGSLLFASAAPLSAMIGRRVKWSDLADPSSANLILGVWSTEMSRIHK